MIFRFDAPLFFANARTFRDQIRRLAAAEPRPRWIVIAAEPITDVDTTAADMLADLDEELNAAGTSLVFAELKDPVRAKLERYELIGPLDPDHFFPTLDAGRRRLPPTHRRRLDFDHRRECLTAFRWLAGVLPARGSPEQIRGPGFLGNSVLGPGSGEVEFARRLGWRQRTGDPPSQMIVKVLMSRSVLLNAAAVGMLIGISILRFEVADPGIMLLAVVPIALLGVMHGVRGGLFGASVASGVLLVWAFTQGHPGAVEEIDEPAVFFMLGLVTGIYAHGALGDCDPRHALQRAELRRAMQPR